MSNSFEQAAAVQALITANIDVLYAGQYPTVITYANVQRRRFGASVQVRQHPGSARFEEKVSVMVRERRGRIGRGVLRALERLLSKTMQMLGRRQVRQKLGRRQEQQEQQKQQKQQNQRKQRGQRVQQVQGRDWYEQRGHEQGQQEQLKRLEQLEQLEKLEKLGKLGQLEPEKQRHDQEPEEPPEGDEVGVELKPFQESSDTIPEYDYENEINIESYKVLKFKTEDEAPNIETCRTVLVKQEDEVGDGVGLGPRTMLRFSQHEHEEQDEGLKRLGELEGMVDKGEMGRVTIEQEVHRLCGCLHLECWDRVVDMFFLQCFDETNPAVPYRISAIDAGSLCMAC
ncbi:hypothetical protein RJ55_04753 [Drechmeria coniospora]|nr:hypothetical protein RJ55_04753 [Drechmeria coniospora]